jgi:hypothetical protein
LTSDVILTTYFTSKQDPQSVAKRRRNVFKRLKMFLRSRRGGATPELPGVAQKDEFERIELWYESLLSVGCRAVIFHDELSPAFTQQWSRPEVQFRQYELQTQRSLNDERYYCYIDFLEQHPEIERVFMLDLFDIEFHRNPFDLINNARYDICCGGDAGEYNNKRNGEKMLQAYDALHYEGKIKLNAGICGGERENVMRLLLRMRDDFNALTARGVMTNLNMAVFNKCVYDLFPENRILYGYPLNSRFKKYEKSGDFALRHK